VGIPYFAWQQKSRDFCLGRPGSNDLHGILIGTRKKFAPKQGIAARLGPAAVRLVAPI
jgi:hypothetical protein